MFNACFQPISAPHFESQDLGPQCSNHYYVSWGVAHLDHDRQIPFQPRCLCFHKLLGFWIGVVWGLVQFRSAGVSRLIVVEQSRLLVESIRAAGVWNWILEESTVAGGVGNLTSVESIPDLEGCSHHLVESNLILQVHTEKVIKFAKCVLHNYIISCIITYRW